MFDHEADPPADVVPTEGPNRATVAGLIDAQQREVLITFPGRPVLDDDGEVVGMTEPVSYQAGIEGVHLSEDEAARLGLPAHNSIGD